MRNYKHENISRHSNQNIYFQESPSLSELSSSSEVFLWSSCSAVSSTISSCQRSRCFQTVKSPKLGLILLWNHCYDCISSTRLIHQHFFAERNQSSQKLVHTSMKSGGARREWSGVKMRWRSSTNSRRSSSSVKISLENFPKMIASPCQMFRSS